MLSVYRGDDNDRKLVITSTEDMEAMIKRTSLGVGARSRSRGRLDQFRYRIRLYAEWRASIGRVLNPAWCIIVVMRFANEKAEFGRCAG